MGSSDFGSLFARSRIAPQNCRPQRDVCLVEHDQPVHLPGKADSAQSVEIRAGAADLSDLAPGRDQRRDKVWIKNDLSPFQNPRGADFVTRACGSAAST